MKEQNVEGLNGVYHKAKLLVLNFALFVIDMIYAIWVWISIWGTPVKKLERRKRFMDDCLDDKRKKGLPARIWYAAYRKRGIS